MCYTPFVAFYANSPTEVHFMDTVAIAVMRRELGRLEARAVRQRKILEDTEVMVTVMRQQIADAEAEALAATRKK